MAGKFEVTGYDLEGNEAFHVAVEARRPNRSPGSTPPAFYSAHQTVPRR